MKILYTGGKTWLKVTLNRESLYFTKENGRAAETDNPAMINYIFSLPNRGEFRVAMEEPKEQEKRKLECDKCGFVAKSEQGLLVHSKTKHKK